MVVAEDPLVQPQNFERECFSLGVVSVLDIGCEVAVCRETVRGVGWQRRNPGAQHVGQLELQNAGEGLLAHPAFPPHLLVGVGVFEIGCKFGHAAEVDPAVVAAAAAAGLEQPNPGRQAEFTFTTARVFVVIGVIPQQPLRCGPRRQRLAGPGCWTAVRPVVAAILAPVQLLALPAAVNGALAPGAAQRGACLAARAVRTLPFVTVFFGRLRRVGCVCLATASWAPRTRPTPAGHCGLLELGTGELSLGKRALTHVAPWHVKVTVIR